MDFVSYRGRNEARTSNEAGLSEKEAENRREMRSALISTGLIIAVAVGVIMLLGSMGLPVSAPAEQRTAAVQAQGTD